MSAPRPCLITGSFAHENGRPVQGWVAFVPQRMWVVDSDGIYWACLAPIVRLTRGGAFSVEVTPTDTDVVPWYYKVYLPGMSYRITVPFNEIGHLLKDLVP